MNVPVTDSHDDVDSENQDLQSASKLLRHLYFKVDFKLGAQMALSPAPPGQCCVFKVFYEPCRQRYNID